MRYRIRYVRFNTFSSYHCYTITGSAVPPTPYIVEDEDNDHEMDLDDLLDFEGQDRHDLSYTALSTGLPGPMSNFLNGMPESA